ncbi:hypothetical protein E2C01_008970 [Portunus trituberculatus]|uniref:Uncharacterized protein n=1 Tax=Portunus trituberculatus TaxID=210409 RepID=A0A5B7D494_PORTR|nr:hypothetical protein [Portunus trituberculatus]
MTSAYKAHRMHWKVEQGASANCLPLSYWSLHSEPWSTKLAGWEGHSCTLSTGYWYFLRENHAHTKGSQRNEANRIQDWLKLGTESMAAHEDTVKLHQQSGQLPWHLEDAENHIFSMRSNYTQFTASLLCMCPTVRHSKMLCRTPHSSTHITTTDGHICLSHVSQFLVTTVIVAEPPCL